MTQETTTKKVFFILPNLNGGGAERVVLSLVASLEHAAEPIDVSLVVFAAEGAYVKHVPPQIRVINLSAPRARKSIFSLWRLCHQEKPDVVFTTMQASSVFGLVRSFMRHRMHWICRMENPITYDQRTMSAIPRWLFRRALERADRVVCLNEEMRTDLLANTAVPANRTVIIPNPIDIEAVQSGAAQPFNLPHTGRAIVMCGRLVVQKNYPLALAALQLLSEKDVHLYILGEGDQQPALQKLADTYGIEQNVHFVGFQDNPHMWMAAADVFVLSSTYEGFGNVLVEALAAGVPVVSTECPTGPQTILSSLPYRSLVPVDDVTALTKAIAEVLSWSDVERQNAVTAGQTVARQYRPEVIGSQYVSMCIQYVQQE